MNKLSIIIPVYNERGTILKILDKINKVDLGMEKEIIIIDDNSVDGTRELLTAWGDKYKILFQPRNLGKGRAIRTGLAEVSGDLVVIQDADLEYDPEDIKLLLAKMREKQAQVVYGSRRLKKSNHYEHYSSLAFAAGGIFVTWLTNLLYGINITDEPTCYKMFRTGLLKSLNLECERFEFCPEVTAKIARQKIKIYEVPINYYPRHKNEGKKINWRDGAEAIWTLIKYRV